MNTLTRACIFAAVITLTAIWAAYVITDIASRWPS